MLPGLAAASFRHHSLCNMVKHLDTHLRSDGALADADTWIFDLDNTLYPSQCDLFAEISQRMTHFVSEFLGVSREHAYAKQKSYFQTYGTTLNGMMQCHGMGPHDFLDFVHDIDYGPVEPSLQLSTALERLPGRKLIYTNGTVKHAEQVIDRLGIHQHFDVIFDIVAAEFVPKPNKAPYEQLIDKEDIDPKWAAMVEDMSKNLAPAAALGMRTVLVQSHFEWDIGGDADHVHHVAEDLAHWLHRAMDHHGPDA